MVSSVPPVIGASAVPPPSPLRICSMYAWVKISAVLPAISGCLQSNVAVLLTAPPSGMVTPDDSTCSLFNIEKSIGSIEFAAASSLISCSTWKSVSRMKYMLCLNCVSSRAPWIRVSRSRSFFA